LSIDRKPIGSKWVFKNNLVAEGKVEKYKARIIAKEYSQMEGIDFAHIFSFVKLTSIRFLVYTIDLQVEQMDVKTTLLHGDLEEEICIKQPKGFAMKGKEFICKMKESLYGLKQSPKIWYQNFEIYIFGLDFSRSKTDQCV
jgi:hypothetical protein